MTRTCLELSRAIFGHWNEKGPVEELQALFTDDFVDHTAPPDAPPNGKDWIGVQYQMFTAAFPDIHFDIVDVVGTGDKLGERIRVTGTHEGELMGIPATGNKVDVEAMAIHVAEDGLCKEVWFYLDNVALMQQLGVMPS